MTPLASRRWQRLAFRDGDVSRGDREVPEEVPVAISYNGQSHAVLMATPTDLEDLGVGFTLTEGLADSRDEIEGPEVLCHPDGIEVRMWLGLERIAARRRSIVGPTGCGLCGIESLAQAAPVPPTVRSRAQFRPEEICAAVSALEGAQRLGRRTRAVHAAGLWKSDCIVELREDVGRHNALDKLAGAVASQRTETANGILALTSRVSVEMVQKAARIGAPLIAAVSAPTALAIRVAEIAQMTLVAIVRDEEFEVFTYPERVSGLQNETRSVLAWAR